jgi:hypothetical protein
MVACRRSLLLPKRIAFMNHLNALSNRVKYDGNFVYLHDSRTSSFVVPRGQLPRLNSKASMIKRAQPMTHPAIFESARVPNTNVFFLGCFETRVTVLSQQVRALNLVDAILDEGTVRQSGKVAIVGGGISGVTGSRRRA